MKLKLFLGLLFLSGVLLTWLGGWLFYMSESSLPLYNQRVTISGVTSNVSIEQDVLGNPTIQGKTILDIYCAQGWITARDRLYQMDLIRRRSGGRLAELLGPVVAPLDEFHRKLNYQPVVEKAVALMKPELKAQFQAYADGVNAFIKQGHLPFEMQVLAYVPEPWLIEDTLLVVLSMYEDIDFAIQAKSERALSLLAKNRSDDVFNFLTPLGGFLDAPILPDTRSFKIKMPLSSVIDIRNENHDIQTIDVYGSVLPPAGSNGWAISGKLTASGKPIIAGDPHLAIFAPAIWYRIKLEGAGLNVLGVSLPGVPGVIIGSNSKVAWTLTTTYGDALDLIELTDEMFVKTTHKKIKVRFGWDLDVAVEQTKWGPVVFENPKMAVQWTALDPKELSQLSMTEFMKAQNSDELLRAFSIWKGPIQNLIYATAEGDIGWAVIGTYPKRRGFDGRTAAPRDKDHAWEGYEPFHILPKVKNPSSGFVVSANQRSVGLTDAGWDTVQKFANNSPSASRAFRIRERLMESKKWTPRQVYDIQLDTYSHQIIFYQKLLMSVLNKSRAKDDEWLRAIHSLIQTWDGHVQLESAAYPFLRIFRSQLIATLIDPIWGVAPQSEKYLPKLFWPTLVWTNHEPVLMALLTSSPNHLLHSDFKTYDEAILFSAKRAAKTWANTPEMLAFKKWGDINRTFIHHTFSFLLPEVLGKLFRMPDLPFSGDHWVPKVGTLYHELFHGASMRMVLDLSNIDSGIFNHPSGQSGHFNSPNYRDQFMDWYNETPTPFGFGPTVYREELLP
jgi:penicillin G amidase